MDVIVWKNFISHCTMGEEMQSDGVGGRIKLYTKYFMWGEIYCNLIFLGLS